MPSLNGGLGSNDDPAKVAENRRRMAEHVGVAPENFLSLHQIHSPDAVVATRPVASGPRPQGRRASSRKHRASRSASPRPIAARCCSSIPGARDRRGACRLEGRADRHARIRPSTAMEKLGADRSGIVAAIGPLIRQHSYEVGAEFVDALHRGGCRQRRVLPARRARRPRDVRSRRLHPRCGWKTPAS